MTLSEVRCTMETLHATLVQPGIRLFFGTAVKPQLGDEMRVSLIAAVNAQQATPALAIPELAKTQPLRTTPEDTRLAAPPVSEELIQGELLSIPEPPPSNRPVHRSTTRRASASARNNSPSLFRSPNDLRGMF